MNLREIDFKPIYVLPNDSFVSEVLVSSLKVADSVDCMFGFFTSGALRAIAPGLAEYLTRSTSPMRLVISPNISEQDAEAIREGTSTPENVLADRLQQLLGEAKLSSSALVRHTLACFAYMLATKRVVFRVAWLKDGGLFHPKVWLFSSEEDCIAVHGSSNFTDAALARNHEQIRVDASWWGETSNFSIDTLATEFEALWTGSRDYIFSMEMHDVIKNELLREYDPSHPPNPEDFRRAWEEDRGRIERLLDLSKISEAGEKEKLTIPNYLNMDEGPFAHQGKAIEAWEDCNRRGILAMATGSGKTITALACAARLQENTTALLIIVSAPYKPLVSQWIEEVGAFGINALSVAGTASDRAQRLDLAVRGLSSGVFRTKVMVATVNFLTSPEFRDILDNIPTTVHTLLIADEVHNLGAKSFISNLPTRFDSRLGLSATPERQYDPDGTAAIFDFFGPKVFEFSLREAIGVCLVPYNYYIHRVLLNEEEYEEWVKLTERLVRAGFMGDSEPGESGQLSQEIIRLLNARRRVIEAAEDKIRVLQRILSERNRDDIHHVLIYATDKKRNQLLAVNAMLQDDLGLTIHQLTAAETQSRKRAQNFLKKFAAGEYNAITCMRVLDEGVDLPQVGEAFLLASNTVRRQWVQRRGRVLRRCDAIKKELAHLHDFVVIPPNPKETGARSILRGELERAREFAELSNNSGSKDGPFDEIEKLMALIYG